tara:strand:- start:1198 stop:1581 length:384 start_codon:yes stop_codon:yes gene_type:complete
MAYTQALVIAGGLAHIPIVTGLFWVFDKSNNPKKTSPKAAKKLAAKPKVTSPIEVTTKTKGIEETLEPQSTLNTETINQDPTITEEINTLEEPKNKASNDLGEDSVDKYVSEDNSVKEIDMDTLSLD